MKKIALAQLTSTEDVEYNLNTAMSFIAKAADHQADLIAFPENALYLGQSNHYAVWFGAST